MNSRDGFETLVVKLSSCSEADNSGCINWVKSKSKKGYGRIWWKGKLQQAHRMSYEAFVGDIPINLHVLHKCDNPSCINPEHLFVGTNKDNVIDKCAKNRILRGEKRINAKLNDQAVIEIRSSQLGKKKLSKIYGVCPTVILEVKRGIRWPHVRDPGDDARDETLEWLPIPSKEKEHA